MTHFATFTRSPRAVTLALGALAASFALLAASAPAAAHDSGGSDIVEFGQSVTVAEGQEVTGDVVVFGGDAKIYGHVDGDAVVMGGNLFIAPTGQVDGSTISFGGSVDNQSNTGNGGRHKHNAMPSLPPMPTMPSMPVVPPIPVVEDNNGPDTGWIGFLIVTGVLSLLAFALTPGSVRTVSGELMRRPILGTAIGFCWPFIFAAILIALAITVIGIVLMPAAVVAVFVAYLVGRAAVALLLGRRLFEVANVMEPAPLATVALGLLIITVVEGFVPLWMGIVLEACVGAVAIGGAMLPFLRSRYAAAAPAGGYMPPPQPVFTPPSPPPPPGPPAVPQ